MRVSWIIGLTAVGLLVGATGCSSMKMPSWVPTFGKSKTGAKVDNLANAPAAPGVSTAANTAPHVTVPQQQNMPVYPGTPYPQTPYAEPAVAGVPQHPQASVPPTEPPVYGSMQPGQGVPVTPYVVPGSPVGTYPQQPASYAQQQPAAQTQPAAAYGQPQLPANYPQQAAYPQQPAQAPASQAGAPYPESPAQQYNAANPSGTYTR